MRLPRHLETRGRSGRPGVSRVIWKRVADQVAQALEAITLEDLCQEREKLDTSQALSHTYGFNI